VQRGIVPFKKDLTIGAGVLAIVGTGLFVIAGAVERGVATAAEVVCRADDILMIVSDMGLEPST
jgi:predicted aconitase with swiveling domain